MRSPLLQRTIECLFGDCPRPDDHARILPILPDLSVGRMLQQGSCFTLHMPGSAELPVASVAKGIIPADCKEQILKELRMMGVSRATLFPDLDNACRDICGEFGIKQNRRQRETDHEEKEVTDCFGESPSLS